MSCVYFVQQTSGLFDPVRARPRGTTSSSWPNSHVLMLTWFSRSGRYHSFIIRFVVLTYSPSKNCHVRNFGTRDLRQANLPDRDDVDSPPPPTLSSPSRSPFPAVSGSSGTPSRTSGNVAGQTSPVRSTFPLPIARGRTNSSLDLTPRALANGGSRSPVRTQFTGPAPFLRANSALPARYSRTINNPQSDVNTPSAEPNVEGNDTAEEEEVQDIVEERLSFEGDVTNTKRVGEIQLPRTVPLSPSKSTSNAPTERVESTPFDRPVSPLKLNSTGVVSRGGVSSLKQTATGTRYGAALGGSAAGPAKTWGLYGATPVCPRCGKNVYFAEQASELLPGDPDAS